jgi:hypothetical protein
MNKLRLCETKKLHYGKYLYKLALANPFAPWFRTEFQKSGDLKMAKSKIEEYQLLYDLGKPMYKSIYRSELPISDSEFLDAKDLYNELITVTEYKVRVERWNGFCIYNNDKDFLLNLANKMRVSAREFWEPKLESIDALLNEKNIVLVDKIPEHPLKITFNYKRIDPSLSTWLLANKDKSTAGDTTISNISSGYASGNYIFIRDERVLTIVQMIVGHNIQRIERLVYKGNIDK